MESEINFGEISDMIAMRLKLVVVYDSMCLNSIVMISMKLEQKMIVYNENVGLFDICKIFKNMLGQNFINK